MTNQATTNIRKDSWVNFIVDSVTVNLFFDGTKNNLHNIDLKRKNANYKNLATNEPKDYESYLNNYSNIANLFKYRLKSKKDVWIYIEGMGSTYQSKDDTIGFAFGSGGSGITARARSAFSEISKAVGSDSPSQLNINIFGFSRGAATARHFIHLAKSKPELFKGWGLKSKQIRFRFVGLFDTVSSFETIPDPRKFNNSIAQVIAASVAAKRLLAADFDDVDELKLDFRDLDSDDKSITKVFHIIAADEYRHFFSLTNCESTSILKNKRLGHKPFGYEVVMNGAHADIGGAYHDNTSDFYDMDRQGYFDSLIGKNHDDEVLKRWFIDQGFYKPEQIKTTSAKHRASRKNVRYHIHKISLKTMRFMAQEFGAIRFKASIQNYESLMPSDIKNLMGRLPQQIFNNPKKWGYVKDVTLPNHLASTKNFRNKYVHWSAKNTRWEIVDDLGYALRIDDKTYKPKRETHHG